MDQPASGPESLTPRAQATSRATRHSIRTVAQIEQDFLEHERTATERIGDTIGAFVGSFSFVALELGFLAAWILINLGVVPGLHIFDKYPFSLLQLIITIQSILLLTFVLMRENRQRRQSEQRDQLHLQVNLLADRKASELLQLLTRVSERLGLEEAAQNEEVQQLSQHTHLETLERELEENLPDAK